MRRSAAIGVVGAMIAGCGSILGLESDYQLANSVVGPDGSLIGAADSGNTTRDAGAQQDASNNDTGAPLCQGHICRGVCLEGTDCTTCDGAIVFCPSSRACVAGDRCDNSCSGLRSVCASCKAGAPAGDAGTQDASAETRKLATATCENRDKPSCVDKPDYAHCGCSVASDCPVEEHTCVLGQCRTCGEPGTNAMTCKGSGRCNASDRNCD
jgi:hypothetical protein